MNATQQRENQKSARMLQEATEPAAGTSAGGSGYTQADVERANALTARMIAEATPVPAKNPYGTACACGKSMCMVQMPYFHCPCCHDTYRLHKLSHPSRCAHCGFNVLQWMRRNAIPRITATFA